MLLQSEGLTCNSSLIGFHFSNVFNPITATNLSNVAIAVQGNLHLPQNVSYVQ